MKSSNQVHDLSGTRVTRPATAGAKKVLIVDDEPTIQLTLSYALRSAGFEVVTASRLETAEEALERYSFDVVIADIRMSGILGVDGLELLSYIKRLLAGHADYTPMHFGDRRNDTTWAHQIASAAIFTSPLLTYAAHPKSILEN